MEWIYFQLPRLFLHLFRASIPKVGEPNSTKEQHENTKKASDWINVKKDWTTRITKAWISTYAQAKLFLIDCRPTINL